MIGYEGVPDCFSWRACEDGQKSADNVVYPSGSNDDSGTVPHESVSGFVRCEYSEVLQQNSRLDQENGRSINYFNDVEPLSNSELAIKQNDTEEVIHMPLR